MAAGDKFYENNNSNGDVIFSVSKAGVKTEAMRLDGATGLASISLDPTLMSDAAATRLGLKQYAHGTNYNGGNAPTITHSGGSAYVGKFIPYQMQDGSWRMRFNLSFSKPSNTNADFDVAGITSLTYLQPIATDGDQLGAINLSRLGINSNAFQMRTAVAITEAHASGDVGLASKPTWAY